MPPMNSRGRSEALYVAFSIKDWEAVIALCSECTAKIKVLYGGGGTCLHEAVKTKAPCRVVRAILDAHKESPVRFTRLTNYNEETALHVATEWFRSSRDEAAVLRMLVESDPHCATLPDNRGYTPLHHMVAFFSCKNDESNATKVACVRALLNASTSESIMLPPYYVFKSTTLHTACSSSRTLPEIVKMILERCPQAALVTDSHGDTPLHYAARKDNKDDFSCAKIILLLDSLNMQGQSGAAAVNDNGQTPLHLAICFEDKNAIKLLIKSQQESVCIKDKEGMTPLDHVQKVYASNMQAAGRSQPEFKIRLKHVCEVSNMLVEAMLSVLHGHEKLTVEESLWMNTEQEWRGNEDLLEHAMIHNYLRLGLSCPLDFVFFLVRLYPHQAQMKDARGVLPLHIALENGVQHATPKPPLFLRNKVLGHHSSVLIRELINAYPQAARVPNRNGDLPFHILLQSRVGDSEWHYCVQPLLRAHPAALLYEETDLLFVLLPLILSRVGKGKDLSALYEFVREMPLLYLR